jgi:hypothetical protein
MEDDIMKGMKTPQYLSITVISCGVTPVELRQMLVLRYYND